MDKIISIHQPDFLPWLGFFEKIARSNTFVILDDVQYLRRGFHNRDKILVNENVQWVSVPTINKGKYKMLIKDVEIDNSTGWKKKFLKTIIYNYKKKKNFELYFPEFEKIFNLNHKFLIDLNISLINFFLKKFNIENKKIIFSSSMSINSKKSEKILNIVKELNGSKYITGLGSKNYLEIEIFKKNNIDILWQDKIIYFKNFELSIKNKKELNLSSLHYLLCYNQ